jgi:hypothetical protein
MELTIGTISVPMAAVAAGNPLSAANQATQQTAIATMVM